MNRYKVSFIDEAAGMSRLGSLELFATSEKQARDAFEEKMKDAGPGIYFRDAKVIEGVSRFPTIVCLCGSTRFQEAFVEAAKNETLQGKIVLSVGMFGHAEGIDMEGPVKKALDELHLRKIDLADEVLFLNVGKYIGESTKRELDYARSKGKTIRYLEPV